MKNLGQVVYFIPDAELPIVQVGKITGIIQRINSTTYELDNSPANYPEEALFNTPSEAFAFMVPKFSCQETPPTESGDYWVFWNPTDLHPAALYYYDAEAKTWSSSYIGTDPKHHWIPQEAYDVNY